MKINDSIDHSIRESRRPSALKTNRRGFLAAGYASGVVLEDDTIITMTGAGTCLRWRV